MRKFFLLGVAAVVLAACGDGPSHHPMHYARLYQNGCVTFVQYWYETRNRVS